MKNNFLWLGIGLIFIGLSQLVVFRDTTIGLATGLVLIVAGGVFLVRARRGSRG
jgi:hypothetical protein